MGASWSTFASARRRGHDGGHVDEQIYVIEADLTFEKPVAPELQELVGWAIARLEGPEGISPKVRWATPSRGLASNVAVSADTRSAAIESATALLKDTAGRSISVPLRSVGILSIKMGTL
jgi:hypothetical protein